MHISIPRRISSGHPFRTIPFPRALSIIIMALTNTTPPSSTATPTTPPPVIESGNSAHSEPTEAEGVVVRPRLELHTRRSVSLVSTTVERYIPQQMHRPALSKPYQRHEIFYLPDGNIIFRVGKILFRFHRSVFEPLSATFRDMVATSASESSLEGKLVEQGSCEENPIIISNMKAEDFTIFLGLIYPYLRVKQHSPSLQDWITILRQAHHWGVPTIKATAAQNIHAGSLDPVEKIALWQRYSLDAKQLASSFDDLQVRPEPLSVAEGELLGIDSIVKISAAREKVLAKPAWNCSTCASKRGRSTAVDGEERGGRVVTAGVQVNAKAQPTVGSHKHIWRIIFVMFLLASILLLLVIGYY
ncbi:hypothetical protein JAAARDRAFT_312836 [Jaapia argillacea MUCL 33604]|uniref:BTB domain-containing protein n=1 Tax=Jaapia argillacea MUCL 33604 TaxID=933084 RepID=A0A067PRM9_9AGAM|nr:hypothetical protein JAAARDRAFT_312836 [Jaapia argillacea MUCL 33604]